MDIGRIWACNGASLVTQTVKNLQQWRPLSDKQDKDRSFQIHNTVLLTAATML